MLNFPWLLALMHAEQTVLLQRSQVLLFAENIIDNV